MIEYLQNFSILVISLAVGITAIIYYISKIRENLPKAKVKIGWGAVTIYDNSKSVLILSISNIGHKEIILDDFYFTLTDKQKHFLMASSTDPQTKIPFPYNLKPGYKYDLIYDIREISLDLKAKKYPTKIKLKGIFRDQTGKIYKSKRVLLNI